MGYGLWATGFRLWAMGRGLWAIAQGRASGTHPTGYGLEGGASGTTGWEAA